MRRTIRVAIPVAICLLLSPLALAAFDENPTPVVLELPTPPTEPAVEGGVSLQLDDGTSENAIGDSGQFIWINRFTPAAADFPFQIEEVQVVLGNTLVPIGGAIEIVVHEDTDGDDDPGTGANYLGSHSGVVQFNDDTTPNVFTFGTPIVVNGPGDVLIGVINRYGFEGNSDFPASLDQTASQGRSWAATYLAGDAPMAPTYPADEQWGTIDSFGFPGNWMIRATGTRIVILPPVIEIPTASEVGLLLLALSLAAAGVLIVSRRA